MEALKKAYAEIILNTSKEAAARVMASEQKAQQFEYDLRLAKEEAFRMLLRLKQMLDAKTAAAEITYLNQQSKIEELEAQLNEAEGMIVDLRVELKQAEEKLDEVKNQNVQPSNKPFEMGYTRCSDGVLFEKKVMDPEPFITSTEFGTRLFTSDIKMSLSDVNVLYSENCMSMDQTVMPSYIEPEKYNLDDQVLSSLRSTEPELYRNGCTQRIRAIGRTGDEKGLPIDGPDVPVAIKCNERGVNVSKVSSETKRFNAMGNFSCSEVKFARGTKDVPLIVCKNRKRKVLYGKTKSSSCMFRRCCSLRSQRPTSISQHNSVLYTSKSVSDSSEGTCTISSAKRSKMVIAENSSQVLQTMQPDKDQAVSVVRRSLRKRKVKQWDDFTKSCGRQGSPPHKSRDSSQPWASPSSCKLVKCNGKSSEDIISETRIQEDIDNITGHAHLPIVKDAKRRNSELTDESVGVKQETTDDAPSQVESNRISEYIFSRKHEKESLINPDGNPSAGKRSRNRRSGEKQNNALGPLGSNMRTESPKHTRRLVQIAQQLISLSGRNSQ